jgi:hypothetical protein
MYLKTLFKKKKGGEEIKVQKLKEGKKERK